MSELVELRLRDRRISLGARGGDILGYEFGPADRPVDLVFSHANGFNARTYRSILAPLGARWRVLMVDMRGHGRTELPDEVEGRDSWLDLRDDLLALIEAEGLSNVVLSGHSMGGCVSLLASAEAPAAVRSLVLFDPVIIPEDKGPPKPEVLNSPLAVGARNRRAVFASKVAVVEAYRGRGAFRAWSEDMLVDYVTDGFRDTDDGQVTLACKPAWEASNFTSHGQDPYDAFDRSVCPIHILRAEVGSTCRVDDQIDRLTQGGRIRIETVPGTSHFLPMERPELVREALEAAMRA
ncbi:alpha/beta fold hydrolase [Phenylobacterium conjunctum]|uniref:Alpha/beta fold hydrolase n=1 Tax=Phenylobacterium conjunctum TaxID=1298959 RepID=A0ABW3SZW5_9CAUL